MFFSLNIRSGVVKVRSIYLTFPDQPQRTSLRQQSSHQSHTERSNNAPSCQQSSHNQKEHRTCKRTDDHAMQHLTSNRRSLQMMRKHSKNSRTAATCGSPRSFTVASRPSCCDCKYSNSASVNLLKLHLIAFQYEAFSASLFSGEGTFLLRLVEYRISLS